MEHSCECRYKDTDKMQYALFEAIKDRFILISAEEFAVYDKYLKAALERDKDIVINLEQSDEEPLQLVYGAMILNKGVVYEEAAKVAEELTGYALFDVEEDRVNVSGYEGIQLFPEDAESDTFIPFAAVMKTIHRLKGMPCSITMFPSMAGRTVWAALANRPFVLACRDSDLIEGLTADNWKAFIDKNSLMEAYRVADLVLD